MRTSWNLLRLLLVLNVLAAAAAAAEVASATADALKDDQSVVVKSPALAPKPKVDAAENNTGAAVSHTGEDERDHLKDDLKQQERNSTERVTDEKEHCCGRELVACLSSSGDANDGMFSLVITGHSVSPVKIKPPSFIHADPSEFTTESGKTMTVRMEIQDAEAAKAQVAANITVESDKGTCSIPLPSFSHNNLLHGFTAIRTPVFGLGVLAALVLSVVAGWAYYQCRDRRNRKNSYQQLEMSGVGPPLSTSVSAPEITMAVNGRSHAEEEGWDQEWDDDWEDAEAGLASLRAAEKRSMEKVE